jgi:ubiquinone/menaquinone biosynthesis C-methylase UbiE
MTEPPADPKQLVRSGYDRISDAYRPDTFDIEGTWYATALATLSEHLRPGGRVLDLGCGCGVPVALHLVETFDVTGVDLSARQIHRARRLVPAATFIRADMTSVEFPDAAFDAIVSLWAIIHVPVAEQPALFDAVARWLRPAGILMITVGGSEWTGIEDDWFGAPMYWSHRDRDAYATTLDARGFTILEEWWIPEDDGGHAAFLARAPGPDGVGAPR